LGVLFLSGASECVLVILLDNQKWDASGRSVTLAVPRILPRVSIWAGRVISTYVLRLPVLAGARRRRRNVCFPSSSVLGFAFRRRIFLDLARWPSPRLVILSSLSALFRQLVSVDLSLCFHVQ
jgi:hypothetical protein